jgi:hypothetical protein
MTETEVYSALETLARETVQVGSKQLEIIDVIRKLQVDQPDDPPVKHLLSRITDACDCKLVSQVHSDLIKKIAYHWM